MSYWLQSLKNDQKSVIHKKMVLQLQVSCTYRCYSFLIFNVYFHIIGSLALIYSWSTHINQETFLTPVDQEFQLLLIFQICTCNEQQTS